MRYFKILLSTLVACILLSSCEKYLDVPKKSEQLFIETAADCQLTLDNYNIMNTEFPSDGESSSDDFYLGTNAYPGFSMTQEDKDIYVWSTTAIHATADPQWLKPYNAIFYTNLVLEALDKIKGSTDAVTYGNLRGTALFLRAYKLWSVAQLYAKPYGATSAQDPGIPVRTSSDLNDAFGRGTVKEVYDKITADLEEAAGLLSVTSSVPSRPNKASAYALLARVYLSMEDYTQALANADASLKLNSSLLDYNDATVNKTSTTPFVRFNKEVLFQSTLHANSNMLAPGSIYSATARIAPDLVSLYDDNDWRKTVFFEPVVSFGPTGLIPDGTYIFTGNYEMSSLANFFNGLTTSEMYLTRAECYARANNPSAAMADLNALVVKRWKNTVTYPVITASSADDALAKVLRERRKELVMRGLRWPDLRRLNKDTRFKKDLSRTVTGSGVTTTYTLPANDPRYILLIPTEVITQAGIQQNQH